MLAAWKESYDKPRQCIKSRHYFADKVSSSQSDGFSSMVERIGPKIRQSAEALMLLNCGVGEDS